MKKYSELKDIYDNLHHMDRVPFTDKLMELLLEQSQEIERLRIRVEEFLDLLDNKSP